MMRAIMTILVLARVVAANPAPGRIAVAEDPARARTGAPALYIEIGSAVDVTPGVDSIAHKQNAELVRAALLAQLAATPQLTSVASEARRFHLDARQIDVSLVRLDTATEKGCVAITAELRIVISDAHGKLLSTLASQARAELPSRAFTPARFEALRKQAVTDASEDVVGKLRKLR
jgi:hypothetical protein